MQAILKNKIEEMKKVIGNEGIYLWKTSDARVKEVNKIVSTLTNEELKAAIKSEFDSSMKRIKTPADKVKKIEAMKMFELFKTLGELRAGTYTLAQLRTWWWKSQ